MPIQNRITFVLFILIHFKFNNRIKDIYKLDLILLKVPLFTEGKPSYINTSIMYANTYAIILTVTG